MVREIGKLALFFFITSCIWVAGVSISYAGPLSYSETVSQPTNSVLILNSYHRGLAWTDDQTDGIVSALRSSNPNILIFVEYLDWKNKPDRKNLELLADSFRLKYANRPISLVMTTDDAALEFALEHRATLFSNALVIFSGVEHQAAARMMLGHTRVTGIYEEIDAENTIKMMLNFNPKLDQIYLIHDNTESGLSSRAPVEQAARRINPALRIIGLNIVDYHAIIDQLRQADPSCCAALMTSYSRDINGTTLEMERFARLFSENSPIPIYTTYDFLVGSGATGGSVLSGRVAGQKAAELGLRILAGDPVPEMPEMPPSSENYFFDYTQLQKYRLPVNQVPSGSRLLNAPTSFYDENKQVVWTLITLFILMLVYIAALRENIYRRKTAEANLKRNNEELAALNEEMLASQEELQAQYQQLAAMQEALVQSDERYKLSFEGANDGLWDWDIHKNEIYLSRRCAAILDIAGTTIINFSEWLTKAVHPDDLTNVQQAIKEHLDGGSPYFFCEHRLRSSDSVWIMARGKALLDAAGKPVRMAGSLTDITERKRQQEAVRHMAYHDALTGLPNRAALREKLTCRLSPEQGSSTGAIILFDIDNFKIVNVTFGHAYGDKLLIFVSQLLQSMGTDLFIARMGGDEFVILMDMVADRGTVLAWFEKLQTLLDQPLVLEEKSIHVTISAGVTMFPKDGLDSEQLMKNADMALYKAKELGKNRCAFFDATMFETIRHKTEMELALREAMSNNEFELLLQPLIQLPAGTISGFEALIRWNSRKYGTVNPLSFVKLAEETGLIVPIGYWVLREACRFIHRLYREGCYNLTVTVNLSVVQLLQTDFAERVQNILAEAGVSPQNLGIEITESVLMESMETQIRKLRLLYKTGLKIYLDDFGTGYSSLKYLQFLPIDVVKIDKSFIDMVASDDSRDLSESIINLIHHLGLKAVAEGVEHEKQLKKLQEFGCDTVQGYLFSKPVRWAEARELLDRYGCSE